MLTVALTVLLSAAPPRVVAAPAWTTANTSVELAAFYADQLAAALRARGVKVVSASDIVALIGVERERQLLGCADSGCMAEIGNALGCDATLVVSFAKLDDTFRASLRILSNREASVMAETMVEAQGERAFADALQRAADRLVVRQSRAADPTGVAALVWAGALSVGLAGALGGVMAGLASNEAAQVERGPYDQAVAAVERGRTFQAISIGAFAVAGVLLVTSVVLGFVRGRDSVAWLPYVSTNGFAWEWP
jgi:hypothetical protein